MDTSREVNKEALDYWPMLKNTQETSEYKLYTGEVIPRDNHYYLYFWLVNHLGLTPLGNFTLSEHFRLVFANNNDGHTMSKFIIFETVKGAEINFKVDPNSIVSLSLEFKLGEVDFIFKGNKKANPEGLCQFILPYSNNYKNGNIVTDPFYKVSIEKDGIKTLAKLVVTDSDVVEGRTVDLDKQFEVVEKE